MTRSRSTISRHPSSQTLRGVPDPETFDLHPDGRHLDASNEDYALVSVIDIETGTTVAEYETGEEPEGVLLTADGKSVSHSGNGQPRRRDRHHQGRDDQGYRGRHQAAAHGLTRDGKELWVSAESSGHRHYQSGLADHVGKVEFLPKGMRREQVTPVDVLITKDGATADAALGRANHVAVVDVKYRKVLDYLLVGKRPWGLKLNSDELSLYVANGLSDDVTIIKTASNRSLISVATGQVPYGMLVDDE